MTGDLVPLPTFEGKEIRTVEHGGEIWLPCRDLSLALGLDRTTLYQHVSRNKDLFEGCAETGDNLSQEMGDIWVNEQGLYLLLARVSLGRVSPVAKTAIIKFRKAVPSLLQQYRKGEIQQTGALEISSELARAKYLADQTGGNLASFQAVALKKCGLPEYAEALLQSVPALVHGETGWFSPTQLGKRCGLNAREVNSWLYNHGYQYLQGQGMDGKIWRLQPKGEPFGREYVFTAPGGHQEIRIAWRESILSESKLIRQPEQLAAAAASAQG